MQERCLVGLVGVNISKSLSPALHEDAFAAAGIAGHYHLMDLEVLPGRANLESVMQAVRTVGFAGINVTHPCKEAVIPLLDGVSREAEEIGAVNTVVAERGGLTKGYNTDRTGFRRAFEETLGRAAAQGQQIVLVGAGGAGRAVARALLDLDAASLLIHDLNQAQAEALARGLAGRFGAKRCRAITDLAAPLADAAGAVNATPKGMLGHPGTAIPSTLVDRRHWIADIVYTPLETQLIATARAKGCRVMSGGGMCVYQAAEAFRLFTRRDPDVARMRRVFDDLVAVRDAELAGAGAN
jgi:shikimate dehydrogenase